MKYKKIDVGPYNIHLINTNKFKTVTIKINFKRKVKKSEITKRSLLSRKLLESIPNILKDLGYDMLYLHTKLINYYDKFGWKKLMPFIKDDGIERNIYIFKI